jgi:peptide/nickel transport system permease protein
MNYLHVLRKNRLVYVGIMFVILVLTAAAFAPLLSPWSPNEQDILGRLQKPSTVHLFGTDQYGRDVLSRVIWGARPSVSIALLSMGISMVIGVSIGIFAAYNGGWIDGLVIRMVDIMMSFPTLILGAVIAAVLGTGFYKVILAIGIAFVPRFIRLARAPTLSVKETVYVEAAKAVGVSDFRILTRHVLPNVISEILVVGTLWLATAIRVEASLSFLGLGVQPPTASWGNMLRQGVDRLSTAPWLAIFPGIAVLILVFGINLVGDGLRDIFDPRVQSAKR